VGAIFTGWIKRTMIDPEFTFNFIGFEFLQPLPGSWMYMYYGVMGTFGFCIMLGYKYRFSAIMYTIMWSATYFMQKASYNNHYYLLILLSAIMVFQPANKYASIDVKQNPHIKSTSMPRWCSLLFIVQLIIVYTYASIAKMYPDWLDLTVAENLMSAKKHYYIIGEVIQHKVMHYVVAYGGILYDGLIIPLLLFKPTRKWAFIASIFFHMFNSIVFQVGIFPYLALGFSVFFFEPRIIHKLFLKKKQFYESEEIIVPKNYKPYLAIVAIYIMLQIALPLRQHVIQDNVLWTEEGHRLSWRMMLRSKNGVVKYRVVNKNTNDTTIVKLRDYLSPKQRRIAATKPDIMWQFAQRLKQEYAANGEEIAVYVDSRVSVNGRSYQQFTDNTVDIAALPWNVFKHSSWILPSKLE
jgi:uncharacterized membrane protein YphA (DoxX/SURF4 family)